MTAATEPHARPLWPVLVAALVGLAILVGLGTWQLQRRAWKEGLIARIVARTTAAPVDLAEAERQWHIARDIEYLRVAVTGRYVAGRDNYYFTTGPAGPGYHVYAPFRSAAGRTLLVNRGYIPEVQRPQAADVVVPRPLTELTLVGLARAPEVPGLFSGSPPREDRNGPWLTRDLLGMAKAAHIAGIASADQLVPFFLDLERSEAHSSAFPQGGTTRLDLPNRHLEYAVTWYGLGVLLLVMTGLFLRSRRPSG
jgi:surfeit locus 1 family protein